MPLDRCRYPKNWPEISRRIRREAGWHCDSCGSPCLLPGELWLDFLIRSAASVAFAEQHWQHPVRFVLTVAHLDQDPSNNSRANLAALCTVCHLRHDHPFHGYNAYRKRERKGQLNLFDLTPPTLAGHGRDPSRIQPPIRIY